MPSCKQYGQGLAERPSVVAINKVDLPEVAEREDELREIFEARRGRHIYLGRGRTGVDELMTNLATKLRESEEPVEREAEPEELAVLRPLDGRAKGRERRRSIRSHRPEGGTSFAETMPA